MNVFGKGVLAGQKIVNSKKNPEKQYFYLNILDPACGDVFQLQMEKPLNDIKQLKEVAFTANLIQGKFPRYMLVSLKYLDEKKQN